MPLTPIQQILKTIETKKHILITTKTNPGADAIASVLAFNLLAKKLGKKTDIVISNTHLGKKHNYDFLPEHNLIQTKIMPNKDIVLEFDIGDTNIQGLTYKTKNQKLIIKIFPNKKNIDLRSPKIKQETYPYDLIVVLDTCDLNSLGHIYDEHTEFFYHTPIINIDHEAENEYFGELNLVDFTATSTTEILFALIETLDKELLDEKISTCLLTGIIYESKSFQTDSITPRSLAIASELMTLGANRELIIQNLFYNKKINTIQLWGRILSNIKIDEQAEIAWSSISENDFKETKTKEQNLLSVVEDLFTHAPESKIIVLIYKQENKFNIIIYTHEPQIDLRRVFYRLGAHGSKNFVECDSYTKKPNDVIHDIKQIFSNN